MAGNLTDPLETALLDYVFHTANSTNYATTATFYVGLCTAAPTDSTTNESTGSGYSRKTISFTTANAGAIYAPSAAATVTFDTATSSWGNIQGYALFAHSTSSVGTNYQAWGVVSPSVAVTSNDQVSFAPSAITLSFD